MEAAWKEIKKMADKKRKKLEWEFIVIKNIVESLGVSRVLDIIGPKRVIEGMGVDRLLANLSPADLKKLKERLK